MIKPFVTTYPGILLKLFNSMIDSNSVSTDWLVSLITAIHKKGERDDPNNYRGISVMSCFGKLLPTILNNRLIKFATERHLLFENQLGFVQGNRTSDPHITLHNLIQKYCHKNKKKIYGCFVDFSKAFDNVSRDILLSKLQKNGVDGKFFDILKTITVHYTEYHYTEYHYTEYHYTEYHYTEYHLPNTHYTEKLNFENWLIIPNLVTPKKQNSVLQEKYFFLYRKVLT